MREGQTEVYMPYDKIGSVYATTGDLYLIDIQGLTLYTKLYWTRQFV